MRAFVLAVTDKNGAVCSVHVFHDWYQAQQEMKDEWQEAHDDAVYSLYVPEDRIQGEVGDDGAVIEYDDEKYVWAIVEDYDYGA